MIEDIKEKQIHIQSHIEIIYDYVTTQHNMNNDKLKNSYETKNNPIDSIWDNIFQVSDDDIIIENEKNNQINIKNHKNNDLKINEQKEDDYDDDKSQISNEIKESLSLNSNSNQLNQIEIASNKSNEKIVDNNKKRKSEINDIISNGYESDSDSYYSWKSKKS